LTARCTPELERVQAELGARTSFRDAARILDTLLPSSPANQESMRNRTHAVALRLEAADRQATAEVMAVQREPDKAAAADERRPVIMLDGASIRAVPGHQVRNFEAICGKVEREAAHALWPAMLAHKGEALGVVHQAGKVDQVRCSHNGGGSSREPVGCSRSCHHTRDPSAAPPASPPRNPTRASGGWKP